MSRTTREVTKQVTLNVPLPLLEDMEYAAKALRTCRSHLILRCVRRDLHANLKHEVQRAEENTAALEKEFGAW